MLKYSSLIIFIAIILISGCTINNKTCEDSVAFTNWSACDSGFQERTKMTFDCVNDSLIGREIERQVCAIPCVSNWSCTNWSVCSKNNIQLRSCNDLNNCANTDTILAVNQTCAFNNTCLMISDSAIKEECNSLVYKSNQYCYNIIDSKTEESCLFSYAYIYSDFNTCDLINTSSPRNTCKATIKLDDSYCDILAPANRSDCNYELDVRYQYLAVINANPLLCNYIQNAEVKADCLENSKPYVTYRDDINDCKAFSYENNSLNYQISEACYIYHIKNSNNNSICDYVGYFVKNECNMMLLNNLTFCYDKSGYERDWCLANFAYYRNNIGLCRDASSEENCMYTVGYWFKEKDYCFAITDAAKKNVCINAYEFFCEENINNCPSVDYCILIADASTKDSCILRKVKNEIKFNNKEW